MLKIIMIWISEVQDFACVLVPSSHRVASDQYPQRLVKTFIVTFFRMGNFGLKEYLSATTFFSPNKSFVLTLKAPITIAADDKFWDIFLNFWKK